MKPNNNPQRYGRTTDGWEISAVKESPNGNPKGEIVPIQLRKGTTTYNILPLLGVDGIVVEIGGNYLVSQKTLTDIGGFDNPHWDILQNGSVSVRGKEGVVGKTIPIIKLDGIKWGEIGTRRDELNKKAGVIEVDYVYEGEEVSNGITKGLIEQINYTLGEYNRPGDTFSYYKFVSDNDPKYDITPLIIAAAQSDGPIDQSKLDGFLVNIDDRLSQLSSDFNSIKRTFFFGELPSTSGKELIRVNKKVASTDDDSPTENRQIIQKSSTTVDVQRSRINAAIDLAKTTPTPTTTQTPTKEVLTRTPRTLIDFENEEKAKWEESNKTNPLGFIRKGINVVWKSRAKKRYDEAKLAGTL